ncbi:hypothetical protein [Undibacter mobilis]|uniref:Uncharacterized protein n=1 Tax=Undibacter mobilis TaxID=2292256 RepID=A0A371BC43_9BRAD|nr:hypothetical protein [Undibacter mobilis]RDV04921.1 hypothetical protein DXH78_10325 [Undibacter mobilis]
MIVRRFPRQAVIAAAVFAVTLSVLVAPARAEDGDEDEAFDSKILRNVMEGLGFVKDGQKIINYQERAPLVIPPSVNLPIPEKPDAAIANNPAWPKDPDIQRKKQAAKQARLDRYKSADEQQRDAQRVLSPNELTPGASATNRVPRVANDPNRTAGTWTESGEGQRLTSSQLGYRGGLFSNMFGGKEDEIARFTGEPPRASLTDPPTGYQTPSADQPYGVIDRKEAPKATNYLESKGVSAPDH